MPIKSVNQEVADAINNLRTVLEKNYGADFSYSINGRGFTLAQHNIYGVVHPIPTVEETVQSKKRAMRKGLSSAGRAVLFEVKEAYFDCWNEQDAEANKRRKLEFRASLPVSRDEAIVIMKEAVPQGYNEFNAMRLVFLPVDAQLTLAREASVCVYVQGKLPKNDELRNDEHHYIGDKNETRLWWD